MFEVVIQVACNIICGPGAELIEIDAHPGPNQVYIAGVTRLTLFLKLFNSTHYPVSYLIRQCPIESVLGYCSSCPPLEWYGCAFGRKCQYSNNSYQASAIDVDQSLNAPFLVA